MLFRISPPFSAVHDFMLMMTDVTKGPNIASGWVLATRKTKAPTEGWNFHPCTLTFGEGREGQRSNHFAIVNSLNHAYIMTVKGHTQVGHY